MSSGIYQIKNTINNLVYIGSSHQIEHRWSEHKRNLIANRHENVYLQRAWNKYGSNVFSFEVVELADPKQLLTVEQIWLNKTRSFDKSIGYNICVAADAPMRGRTASLETRAKLCKIRKGKGPVIRDKAAWQLSIKKSWERRRLVPVSGETRKRMSFAHKGHHSSEIARKHVSLSKLGSNNPSYKEGKYAGKHKRVIRGM